MPNDPEVMFIALIDNMSRDDINDILLSWNESQLNDDDTEIIVYTDSRSNGPHTGGADIVDKAEFFAWLLSDAPFDTKVYGEKIRKDEHWVELIGEARSAEEQNLSRL
jgi:hypothetical protein